MANKLAGQKAKYTRFFADYNRTEDVSQKERALRFMKEVIDEAPDNGFSVYEVTSGQNPPAEIWEFGKPAAATEDVFESSDQLVQKLEQTVNASDLREVGQGEQFIYAYGYPCAPDRLKVGRSEKDVVARIVQQINTSTPDKPKLVLVIRTPDCRALEIAIHSILRLRDRRVVGGGSEWFLTTRDELLGIYEAIDGLLKS